MNLQDFSSKADEVLIRHKSILDLTSKLQEATARINRAIAKAVTECGCIRINAGKQNLNPDVDYSHLDEYTKNHIQGQLCERCAEQLKEEVGDQLFYLVSICNALDLDLDEILEKKYSEMTTLGKYGLF